MSNEQAMTEAEPTRPEHEAMVIPDVIGPPGPSEFRTMQETAATISSTDFVPNEMRNKPAVVLAAILTGREMGLGPMASLQGIRIQDGKPAYDAELMRALVRKRGHTLTVLEKTHQRCRLYGRRRDTGEEAEVVWDLDDALIAGLIDSVDEKGLPVKKSKNGFPLPWQAYPKRMLFARATSELVSDLFADVLVGGSYTPEELGSPEDWDGPQPEPDTDEVATGKAWARIREATDRGKVTKERAEEIGKALQADIRTLEGALAVADAVEHFEKTGALPPTEGQVTEVEPEPEGQEWNLAAMIRKLPEDTKWEPTEEELTESGDPIEERRVLLNIAADTARDRRWDEITLRRILGYDGRRNTSKAFGEMRLLDLRTAVEMLMGEEARQVERNTEEEETK